MGASKSLLKLRFVSGLNKLGDRLVFFYDRDFANGIFLHQVLGNAVKKIEHTGGTDDVNCMEFVFIVAL
jgi:hypothetical protein